MTASLLRSWVCVGVLLAGGSMALAQRHREPLTQSEIDQIRDASWEPKQRLALYVQFTRSRLVKLEEMRSDPKTKNRARQTQKIICLKMHPIRRTKSPATIGIVLTRASRRRFRRRVCATTNSGRTSAAWTMRSATAIRFVHAPE